MNAKAVCLLLAALMLAGCNRNGTTPDEPSERQAEDLPELTGEVQLTVADWDEIQRMIAERSGRVVVVDFWSTWCDPCKREFPHLVQLQRMYPDRVACMSVSLDYIGDTEEPDEETVANVREFLEAQGARFQNVISSVPDEQLYPMLGFSAIPAVFVYDQQGELARRFVDETIEGTAFSYEDDIIPFVEQLLAQPAAAAGG